MARSSRRTERLTFCVTPARFAIVLHTVVHIANAGKGRRTVESPSLFLVRGPSLDSRLGSRRRCAIHARGGSRYHRSVRRGAAVVGTAAASGIVVGLCALGVQLCTRPGAPVKVVGPPSPSFGVERSPRTPVARAGPCSSSPNGWVPISEVGAPSCGGCLETWTGERVLVMDTDLRGAMLDPCANQWTPTAPADLADGSRPYSLLWVKGRVIATDLTARFAPLREFDPRSNTWRSIAAPEGGYGANLAVSWKDSVVFFSGQINSTWPSGDA